MVTGDKDKYPILGYVQKLEQKVRDARNETTNYKKLAFIIMMKGPQFWLGFTIGICGFGGIVGVWKLVGLLKGVTH